MILLHVENQLLIFTLRTHALLVETLAHSELPFFILITPWSLCASHQEAYGIAQSVSVCQKDF